MSGTRSDEPSKSLINYSFSHTNAHGAEALLKELGLFRTLPREGEDVLGKDVLGKHQKPFAAKSKSVRLASFVGFIK